MMSKRGKLIVFSAPSGSGKTTIVRALLKRPELNLAFSVSATSRPPRGQEVDGMDYYFLSQKEFEQYIRDGAFLEWEEVYPGQHYGTLLEEVNRLLEEGKNVVFDIDVIGGLNIKKQFNDEALALFVQPPSIEVLAQRLEQRGTDSSEKIHMRLEKARLELSQAPNFDHAVINESIDQAIEQAHKLILNHIA
jgi:guanylate kinase